MIEENPEAYGAEIVRWGSTDYGQLLDLRREGKTVEQIADLLQISVPEVKRALTNRVRVEAAAADPESLGEILQTELDRLDYLVQAHYYAAIQGDIDSTKAILSIGKERREWLKWAKPESTKDININNNILVVGGDEDDFLAGLEAARKQLESDHGQHQ